MSPAMLPSSIAMRGEATYVYCVVANAKGAATGRAPKGLPGAGPPRRIEVAEGYQAVVATVPLALYSSEAIEPKLRDLDWVGAIAAAHETVVEHASAAGTVVPMKLFTIFSSDERAAAHVQKTKRTLDRVVRRIGGCQEWGLRILLDEKARPKPPPKRPSSGTGFLLAKREQQAASRSLVEDAKTEVEDLYDRLERAARGAVKRPPPSRELAGRVLLDAVFLVPQTGAKKFKSTVASTAKGLAKEGFHVSLSGPWPAYSFVENR